MLSIASCFWHNRPTMRNATTESTANIYARSLADAQEFMVPKELPERQFRLGIMPILERFIIVDDTQSIIDPNFTFDALRLRRAMDDCVSGRAKMRKAGPASWGHIRSYLQDTLPQAVTPKESDTTGLFDTLYRDDGASFRAVTPNSFSRNYTDSSRHHHSVIGRDLPSIMQYGARTFEEHTIDTTIRAEDLAYTLPRVFSPHGFALLSAQIVMHRHELPFKIGPSALKEVFLYGAAIRAALAEEGNL